eukprot:9036022-Karenia_brevis.AAC.1
MCQDVAVASSPMMSLMSRNVAVAKSPVMAEPSGSRGRDVICDGLEHPGRCLHMIAPMCWDVAMATFS